MLNINDIVICTNNENAADLLSLDVEYTIENITNEGLVTLAGVEGLFCDWRFIKVVKND